MAGAGVFRTADLALLVRARLGDAVRYEVNSVQPTHVLLFEEIGGVALALGEDGDEHVGAGHFFFTGGLDVDHGALNDALESGGGARVLAVGHDEAVEFLVDEIFQIALQRLDVHVATGEDGERIPVVGEGQQQMLERGEFMGPLTGEVHRLMQGLLESAGE